MMTEVTSELRVFMPHVRAALKCSGGARDFFKKYGLNWSHFLDNGIPVAKLEEIGDPLGLAAVAVAREQSCGR